MEQETPRWYALRTRSPKDLERVFAQDIACVPFLPMMTVQKQIHGRRVAVTQPYIANVLFVRTLRSTLEAYETRSHRADQVEIPFFTVYRRLPSDDEEVKTEFETIPEQEMHLFKLLTSGDTQGCEIYNKELNPAGKKLEVIAGMFKGYQGFTREIRHNKRIMVELRGQCVIALPCLHPDLFRVVSQ